MITQQPTASPDQTLLPRPNGEPHPVRRIPGNADAIAGEIRRIDDLKERLWSTGETLRRLNIDGWSGPARDAFDEFRHRFAHQWLTTGDLHEDVARALERYHRTLIELRRRVGTVDLDAINSTADMGRWSQQLNSEARAAATAVRRAAQALAGLPRLLDQPTSVAVAPQTQTNITAPPMYANEGESDKHVGLDPRTAQSDPAGFHRRVQTLSDEILLANFITITAI